jgi:hypothetical protein
MLMARLAGQTGGVGFPTLPGAPMSFPMTSGFPGGLLPGVVPGMGLPGMPVLPGLPALGGLGAPSPLLPTAGAMPIVSPTVAPRPVASAFMLLKNMFDPAKYVRRPISCTVIAGKLNVCSTPAGRPSPTSIWTSRKT